MESSLGQRRRGEKGRDACEGPAKLTGPVDSPRGIGRLRAGPVPRRVPVEKIPAPPRMVVRRARGAGTRQLQPRG